MLSFPSQNDKEKFFDQPGVLKKIDPGSDKPTYF